MKKSFLLSLAVGVLVVMVAACDKAAVHVEKDGPIAANDDDAIIQNDDLAEDDLLMPEEDTVADVDHGTAVPVDDDFIPDENSCYDDTDAGVAVPVDGNATTRLTRQWGGLAFHSDESGGAVAVDVNGNIFVTGSTDGLLDCIKSAGGEDIFLTKMSVAGTVLWTRQWGTEADDAGLSVAVDAAGDIYVIGSTRGVLDGDSSAGNDDVFITKWTGEGAKLWTRQWGTAGSDKANAVTVNADGDIILTGVTDGDIFLAKWSAEGQELWSRTWGTEQGDIGNAVTTDANGDIWVTGLTVGDLDGNTNAGGDCDCALTAVSAWCFPCADIFLSQWSTDGVKLRTLLWGASGSNDQGSNVVVDVNGDILLQGLTEGHYEGYANAGGDCGYFDPTAQTHLSQPCSDPFLVKLNADGTELWARQWGTVGDDASGGLAIDAQGAVITGGMTITAWDGNGVELWSKESGVGLPGDIAVSSDGTIILTGSVMPNEDDIRDIFIGIWDGDGTAGWSKTLGGATAFDRGRAVAQDAAGNIFVAGSTAGSLSGNTSEDTSDVFLTKWNNDGTRAWSRQTGSPKYDHGLSVAVDAMGGIFVAGVTAGALDGNTSAGSDDLFLIKWSDDGSKEWTKQWGTSKWDMGLSVAIDKDGNVYITGVTGGALDGNTSAGRSDVFLEKIDNSGVSLWTRQWGTDSSDSGYSVAVDVAGFVYVTGETMGELEGFTNGGSACVQYYSAPHSPTPTKMYVPCTDVFLTKFASDGTMVWTKQWGSEYNDAGRSVAVDSAGNIYVAGATGDYSDGNNIFGDQNMVLTKLGPDGTQVWTKQWGSTAQNGAMGVAISSTEAVLVTGYTYKSLDGALPAAGGDDVFLIKVDGDGTQLWAEQWGSVLDDYGSAVIVGSDGRIFVVGSTDSAFDGNLNMGGTDAFLSIVEEK